MRREKIDIVRGSGNVFRDFGDADADREQLRAILAARIVTVLDARNLTVRKAGELTGVAAADFSRLRRARLGRFTIDRLMIILSRLDQRVDVSVTIRSRRRREARAA
jgi:predicted XRE-type DNA-binding protein